MRDRAYARDLVLGQRYIHSNGWHPECEYGDIWYVGTAYNKYDELLYCFSDEELELPEGYDGDADSIWYPGGPVFTEGDLEHGDVAMA